MLHGHYENAVDRHSAYEILKGRQEQQAAVPAPSAPAPREEASPLMDAAGDVLGALAKSAARSIGTSIGRQIVRGVLGSIFGGAATSGRGRR
ncbi:MAG: helicase HerA-like domain-containing protein, partial [Acidobacteriota bacterium]